MPTQAQTLEIHDCADCPFYRWDGHEGSTWCEHDEGQDLDFERTKPPPEWCPLRKAPVLLKLLLE